jgi:hypothetical protein
MPCHLPSQFLQFCVNGIALGLVYPFYYLSVNPALVLHIPMLHGAGMTKHPPSNHPIFLFWRTLFKTIPKKVSSYWGKQILIGTHVNWGLGLGLARLGFGSRKQIWHGRLTQDLRPTRRPASQFKTSKTLSKERPLNPDLGKAWLD